MRRAIASLTVSLVATLAALATTPATADYLYINFHGLGLTFAGGQIYDADHPEGGSGSAADATALTSIVFTKNSTEVASLTSNVSADIRLGVPNIPVDGSVDFTPTSAGFIDLFNGATMCLHLPVTSATVSYDEDFGFELDAFASSGIIQNLPGGLMFDLDEPIDKPISVQLFGIGFTSTTIEGDYLTGFAGSSGYGLSAGTLVPEPGSLVLLLSLAASALAVRRRVVKTLRRAPKPGMA